MKPRVVVIGARPDGHARVVADALRLAGRYELAGFLDDNERLWKTRLEGAPVLGGLALLAQLRKRQIRYAVIGVGENAARRRLAKRLDDAGVMPASAIHPRACVARGAVVEAGAVILAGAVVNPGAVIGAHAVVNTAATVDHDCRVGAYAFLGPGAHLAGRVRIGDGAFLGTGAVAIPDAVVGAWAVVGAGSVVVDPVPAHATVVGAPARPIRRGTR